MDASDWIAIVAVVANPITGTVAYFWGKRDERKSLKVEHDKTVFARLDAVLPHRDLKALLDNLDDGYFFREAGIEAAVFQNRVNDPENAFLDATIQEKVNALSLALRMAMAYAGEHFSMKDGDVERLWLHPEKKYDSRRELLPLIEQAEQRYKEFRAAIKEKLAV